MSSLARKIQDDSAGLSTGTVSKKGDGTFSVSTSGREVVARRAASCLLEPERGDRVLLATADQSWFVLAVLLREPGARHELTVDGDLRLAPKGSFEVASQEGIELATAGKARLVAGQVDISADRGSIVLDHLTFVGAVVKSELKKLSWFAEAVDSMVDRTYQRVKRSYRVVEELEQVRAHQIDMTASESLRVHAKTTAFTAEALVKIDGEQVHIG